MRARDGGPGSTSPTVQIRPFASHRIVDTPEWAGRCNLGLDQLVSSHVHTGPGSAPGSGLEPRPTELLLPEVERPDPLEPFRRRVARLALGGRGTLPGDARSAVEREIAALGRVMMPVAGQVLGRLADAAAASRTEGGAALAERWLAAATYEQAATRSLQRASWS